jgi:hypothetical protein
VGLPQSPVEFSFHRHFYKLSRSWLLGMCCCSCLVWPACLFTIHMGSGSSPLSCGVFLPLPLLQAFLLQVAGCVPSPFGVLWGISPPSLFGAQSALPTLLHVFFVVIAYYSVFFSFFTGLGSVCPGGYADLAQGCLLEYCMLLSSPCGLCLPKPSGHYHLAVACEPPFNVKWRCYVQAAGVEESKFCLFSAVFPVRCMSSIFPRFYLRRHAFCFLPLAAILESRPEIFLISRNNVLFHQWS